MSGDLVPIGHDVEPLREDAGYQGIVYGLPEEIYHAHPALSSTQVKWMLDAPARYHYNVNHPQPHKPAFDLGSALHADVLGTGWEVVRLDFPDFRTKAAQQARDEAYAASQIPLLEKDFTVVKEMSASVLAHAEARALLERGNPEVSVFARCPVTSVDMRCRFDYLQDDLSAAVDLKSMAGKATRKGFGKIVADYGYDVSQGHYLDTLELATGERPPMLFIAVEKDPPYFTAVFRLSNDEIEMGKTEARAARMKLRACRDADLWPGRDSGIQISEAPMRRIYDFTDKYGVAS